jgi:beta-xylosidase
MAVTMVRLRCWVLCVCLLIALRSSAVDAAPRDGRPGKTYRNPIIDAAGGADPDVIKVDGKYYLYPTLDGRGYDVFVSDDLVHWEKKGKCFTDPRGGAWAPDVFHNVKGDGEFYLYYTLNHEDGGKMVGVAKASSPLGPFKDVHALMRHAIDAHLFQDEDGKMYLYCVQINRGSRIVCQRMSDPVTASGDPVEVIHPTEPWERKRGSVTEGPFMLKQNGTYYLMFSGSAADGPDYGVGYATSKSPMGPFKKYDGNPIAHRGGNVLGPGHHCVVEGPHGGLWMVYHQKASTNIGWDRFLAIDPLWFDDHGVIHATLSRATDEPAP